MAEISFSLAELFERAFGYKSQAFHPEFSTVQGDTSPYRTEQGFYGSPYYAADALGNEYFLPVTISYQEKGKTNSNSTELSASTGQLKKWNLPYPVVSITSRKTIVETHLTERRGSVKELVNIQDYEIKIRGFIINQANEFPESDVSTLRNIYEQNQALSIQCPITDIFLLRPDRSGSDQVVITDLKFPAVSGIKNVRPYELSMISDAPFNLVSIS